MADAGYTGAAKDKVLRDNIISGLASDKIRAKIVKEGHEVTLNWVMEIARLEVSTQQHLDRMQETAKDYVQYGRSTKSKKKSHNLVQGRPGQGAGSHKGAGGHRDPVANHTNDLLSRLTPATDVGRGNIARHRTARLWMLLCRGCGKKGHYEKVACKANTLHTLWRHHRRLRQGLGPVNPYISMVRDNQFTHTWLVFPMQTNT